MDAFPKRLRLLRETRQESQIDLAKVLALSNSTVSQYEAGRRMPDPDILTRLADHFGVSVDYLVGRTDRPDFVATREGKTQYIIEAKTGKDLDDRLAKYGVFLRTSGPLTDRDKEKILNYIEFLKYEEQSRSSKGDGQKQ